MYEYDYFLEKYPFKEYFKAWQIDKPSFMLTDILTKKADEDSVWDSFHLWGAYGGHTSFNFTDKEYKNAEYAFDVINAGLDGKLKDNNGDLCIKA